MKQSLSHISINTADTAIDTFTKDLKCLVSDPVSLSIGLPNETLIPKKQLEEVFTSILNTNELPFYHYCDAKGMPQLVETIANNENTSPEHILITSGNTQGIELSTRLFINNKDVIAMEEYSYSLIHTISKQYQSDVVQVPLSFDGLDTDYLEEALKQHKIKMLYVIPNSQNPTGITLSLKKRQKLIELAYKYDFMIIEDDPYRDLSFHKPLPSLFELDPKKEKVVYLYSFSKTIAPTLRTGFILAHPYFIDKFTQLKQIADSCTSPLHQLVINKLINSNEWSTHLLKTQQFYEERKEITKSFLAKMNNKYGWTSYEPAGGMFYWVDLQKGDALEFLKTAYEQGVLFIPGQVFSLDLKKATTFRLCYSYCSNSDLEKAFSRLESSYSNWLKIQNKH
ncbi:PLP-dependent aminotransferase family protein [Bacillus sp. Brlt_9]|uniref:aminotransferase-like domain-containing protein n=1 Tax=Bacillus sp. Brlt_9 TaxID=3110916 RepID=UPI003F7C43B8